MRGFSIPVFTVTFFLCFSLFSCAVSSADSEESSSPQATAIMSAVDGPLARYQRGHGEQFCSVLDSELRAYVRNWTWVSWVSLIFSLFIGLIAFAVGPNDLKPPVKGVTDVEDDSAPDNTRLPRIPPSFLKSSFAIRIRNNRNLFIALCASQLGILSYCGFLRVDAGAQAGLKTTTRLSRIIQDLPKDTDRGHYAECLLIRAEWQSNITNADSIVKSLALKQANQKHDQELTRINIQTNQEQGARATERTNDQVENLIDKAKELASEPDKQDQDFDALQVQVEKAFINVHALLKSTKNTAIGAYASIISAEKVRTAYSSAGYDVKVANEHLDSATKLLKEAKQDIATLEAQTTDQQASVRDTLAKPKKKRDRTYNKALLNEKTEVLKAALTFVQVQGKKISNIADNIQTAAKAAGTSMDSYFKKAGPPEEKNPDQRKAAPEKQKQLKPDAGLSGKKTDKG